MSITVVGSLNMDYRLDVHHIPQGGETILSSGMTTAYGGKGLNQAVAAARAGSVVHMMGSVGQDANGRIFLDFLKKEKIGAKAMHVSGKPTGQAIIVVDAQGQNCIIVNSGSNFDWEDSWVENHKEQILSANFCILQMEIPLPVIYQVLTLCEKHGVQAVLNPSPVNDQFDRTYLSKVDYLVLNECEMEHLTETKDPKNGVDALIKMGVKNIVFTCGSRGCIFFTPEKKTQFSAYSVHAVDTTGAGDTFLGAFVSCLNQGKPVESALSFASAAAALAVTRFGAIPSIPKKKETEKFLQSVVEGKPCAGDA